MTEARGLHCSFLDESCRDGRCKVGYCAKEREIEASYGALTKHPEPISPADEKEVLAFTKKVVLEYLRRKRIKPTEKILDRCLAHPPFVEEARRRIAAMRNSN
jgi:hypothetical protein